MRKLELKYKTKSQTNGRELLTKYTWDYKRKINLVLTVYIIYI